MSKALTLLESIRDSEPEKYNWLAYEYSRSIHLSRDKLQERIRRATNLAINSRDINAKHNNIVLAQFLMYMQDTAQDSK